MFSPTDISARQWFLYDEDNTDQNISITISPYQALDPVYSTDLSTGDEFGYDISINDWNESIIGSPGDNTSLGSVYVFEINSSSHQLQKQKILPILTAGESNRTKFGASITTFEVELLIGAPDANDFTGKVYHYNRDDGNYTFLHSLRIQLIQDSNLAMPEIEL